MPWFEVIVQHANGSPARRWRVSNDYNFKDVYTDDQGRAVFEAGRSTVTVYVDGKDCGTARAGRMVVTVK